MAGIRWDGREDFAPHPVSPQVSIAVQALSSTQLQFGFGRYAEITFPDTGFQALPNPCVFVEQSLSKSYHYTAAIEQRFGENTRLRLQAFDRQNDRQLSFTNPSPCTQPVPVTTFFPASRDYSRGFQLILQRRSANRLYGWIGYTLLHARQSTLFNALNGMTGFSPYFDFFEDQRHTINAFGSYRVTPSMNVSGKILYGSGFPVESGFTVGPGGGIQLIPVRRLGPYQRLDLRFDKAWAFKRWKLTLYTEILNLTNHENGIFAGVNFVNGHDVVIIQRTLPVTPTAGLVFEF